MSDLTRRVSGPLDRSAFASRSLELPPAPRSYELSRLSLYRLGLSGTFAKYRVVPRSATVGYEELQASVRAHRGDGALRDFVAGLWQRHGAPSPEIVEAFLGAAALLDRCGADTPPAELEAIVEQARSVGGGRLRRRPPGAPVRSVTDARERLLDGWLHACAPRSTAGRACDAAELGICFVLRRTRQIAVATFARRGD